MKTCEWQTLAEGDRILAVPDGSAWFDVAMIDPAWLLRRRDLAGV